VSIRAQILRKSDLAPGTNQKAGPVKAGEESICSTWRGFFSG